MSVKVFLFGDKILHIPLYSKITLNSASKLKAFKHNTSTMPANNRVNEL